MKKIILFAAALSLSTSAFAMNRPPVDPSTQPVPAGQFDQLAAEYNAFLTCELGTETARTAKSQGVFTAADNAFLAAQSAVKKTNNGAFQINAETFRSEVKRLGPQFGC